MSREYPTTPKKRRYPLTSQDALKEMAFRYVARFSCTTDKLRRYLVKKLREALVFDECRPSDINPWVDAVLTRLTELGILNDDRYAEGRAMTLHRRGRAERVIQRDLSIKGAPPESIVHAIEALNEEIEDPDLVAAIRLARKKRLGPYADPATRVDKKQKHLASLARAGFRFDLARRIIEASDVEELNEILQTADGNGFF